MKFKRWPKLKSFLMKNSFIKPIQMRPEESSILPAGHLHLKLPNMLKQSPPMQGSPSHSFKSVEIKCNVLLLKTIISILLMAQEEKNMITKSFCICLCLWVKKGVDWEDVYVYECVCVCVVEVMIKIVEYMTGHCLRMIYHMSQIPNSY